jgi:tryptophan halogenase
VQLHYVKSQRQDSAFWRHCQSLPVSDSLQERIDLFTAQGLMDERSDDLFRPSSWLAIFEGMGIRPRHNSPKVAHLSAELLHQELTKTAAAIDTMVKTLPRQEEFWHSATAPSRQAQP